METKAIVLGILALGLVIVLGSGAYAYDAMPTPEGMGLDYSITAGAVFSVNSDVDNSARPAIGFSWYGPAEPAFGDMAAFGLSAAWLGLRRNDGKDVQLAPVTLNYKRSAILGGYRVFVALGLGIWYATDNIPAMKIDTGASFAWTGGVGLDFTNTVFGQAMFYGGQNPGQDGMVSISLGYRF